MSDKQDVTELDFGMTLEELATLEDLAEEAQVSCEGGSEGSMG